MHPLHNRKLPIICFFWIWFHCNIFPKLFVFYNFCNQSKDECPDWRITVPAWRCAAYAVICRSGLFNCRVYDCVSYNKRYVSIIFFFSCTRKRSAFWSKGNGSRPAARQLSMKRGWRCSYDQEPVVDREFMHAQIGKMCKWRHEVVSIESQSPFHPVLEEHFLNVWCLSNTSIWQQWWNVDGHLWWKRMTSLIWMVKHGLKRRNLAN